MRKLFNTVDIDSFSKIYLLLGYKEVSRKKTIFKNVSLVKYEKEKEVENYKSLKDRYAPYQTIPFFFVIMFAVIAVGFATSFLLVNILIKDVDKLFYFYVLMIPTFVSTLIATSISFYRYFSVLKNIERVTALPLLEREVKK